MAGDTFVVMADPNPSERIPQPSTLAGVHLPGSGRLRLCRALVSNLVEGDWVAVDSAHGVEGGQITIAPELLTGALSSESYGVIARRLNEGEIRQVAELAGEACSLLVRLGATTGSLDAGSVVAGLRFTLPPKKVIIGWCGATQSSALEDWLNQNVDLPYALEHDGTGEPSSRLYGGLGRLLPTAASLDEIIHQRFEPAGSERLPAGSPRLLSNVSTPQGAGIVISVSTKHRQARVKLADDIEILVPLSELQVVDWNR